MKPILSTILVLVLAACSHQEPDSDALSVAQAQDLLRQMQREHRFANLLLKHAEPSRESVLIENARCLDPGSGKDWICWIEVDQGRIARIGNGPAPDVDGAIVNLQGQWLMPGLADMHVHLLSGASQYLLQIAHGVTTVREMVGFDWILQTRIAARQQGWTAPEILVASPIISSMPMGPFASVAEDEAAARALVREFKLAGYDYIKVHNVLALPVYDAVLDESQRQGIRVVGHIPHTVSVAHAIEAGQWTAEHLKGPIDDRTLTPSIEDWQSVSSGASIWIVPTLYATRMHTRGAAAEALIQADAAGWIGREALAGWRSAGMEPLKPAHAGQSEVMKQVLGEMLGLTDRIVSGTDSGGGYPFMVPGLALHDEFSLLAEAGMDNQDILRAATSRAAQAALREGDFGALIAGARADFVVVESDPRRDLTVLRKPREVWQRGRRITRTQLDGMLSEVSAIAQAPIPEFGPSERLKLQQEHVDLARRGYIHSRLMEEEFHSALQTLQAAGR